MGGFVVKSKDERRYDSTECKFKFKGSSSYIYSISVIILTGYYLLNLKTAGLILFSYSFTLLYLYSFTLYQ